MPPIRKSRVTIREQVRWSPDEHIRILSFLDNNFEMWHSSRLDACAKAIEATNNQRDAKTVYNKIRVLIKSMEVFRRTGEKPNTCAVIWDNQRIQDLVESIYNKIEDKKDKNQNNEDCITNDESDASTIRTDTDDNVPQQMLFSAEVANKLYREKVDQITQNRAIVIKQIEETNNTFEETKVNLPLCTNDDIISIFEKKIQEITKYRDELLSIVKGINNKCEEMKKFK
ncbi:hypothetical protein RclHR1_33450002 [Rhizophagus clarus]|uniref:Uncharacterized protein n=1 Tax=Rhizophagus clarus TaxID=94130 RepID=A0A2Z6S458_9GLOM|nr:hypothetical protein RclHR1_33450002 [Rhizophagus clarus]GES79998.1 hypothetical protein GLOIN_2v1722829 [Rhizophagus clarus]